MLGDADEVNRRRPFEFLSNIFKRRREHDDVGPDLKPPEIHFSESDYYNEGWSNEKFANRHVDPCSSKEKSFLSSSVPLSIGTNPVTLACSISTPSPVRSSIMIATATVGIPLIGNSVTTITTSPSYATSYTNGQSSSPGVVTSLCPSPMVVHQTPIKSRDIGEDMEAIRLSRQDNPYLQRVAGSETSLADEDVLETGPSEQEEDTTHLVSQSRMHQDNALTLSEVHEHLIRSPPPTSVPKTISGKGIFIFPTVSSDATEHQGESQKCNEIVNIYTQDSSLASSRIPSTNLNPLISRGHEDVLDQHLRQVLDTQRKLSNIKGDINISISVPGSPARLPSHSVPLQVRKNSHIRALSEETSAATCIGTVSASYASEGILAPVLPPGKKQPTPNDILSTHTRMGSSTHPSSTPNLLPINRNARPKRNFSHQEHDSLLATASGSSTSLTLPIKSPNQPASSKIT